MTPSFRTVADRDLTAEQQEKFNLILVGEPDDNLVTRRLLPSLPLKIEDQHLHVKWRDKIPLQNRVLSLLHPHPEYPQRLIYLVAPFLQSDADWKRFSTDPQRFLIGSSGFDRISQADLAVMNLDHKFCRQMQFVQGWTWLVDNAADTSIPERFGERSELAREFMKAMLRASAADFALWWGPADQGMWGTDFNFLPRYDADLYTLADFRTQRREFQTLTGSVGGTELREIWERWGERNEILVEPAIDFSEINDEKSYRLHIPMDFYIKLGQRKKALADPEPGPRISFRDVESSVFDR